MKSTLKKPRLVFTTDVNGTTTAENTFAELVRPDGLAEEMAALMTRYTNGDCSFSEVLEPMASLTRHVDRGRLENHARRMQLFEGVKKTFSDLLNSERVDSFLALSTTGFAGLMALVNFIRHEGKLMVAASPVLLEYLSHTESACLIHDIVREEDKAAVIDKMVKAHDPTPGLVFHVGDTLGDFAGITHAAKIGGLGIAFRPNNALKARIGELSPETKKNIALVEPIREKAPDYGAVLEIVMDRVKKVLR